jgi:hypothetical protein
MQIIVGFIVEPSDTVVRLWLDLAWLDLGRVYHSIFAYHRASIPPPFPHLSIRPFSSSNTHPAIMIPFEIQHYKDKVPQSPKKPPAVRG